MLNTILSFYLLGMAVFAPPLIVTWVANEDILTGSNLPSTFVTIAGSVELVGKLIAMFTVNRIPLSVSMIFHSFVSAAGLLLVVMLSVNLRVIGVVTIGFSYGFGTVLYLRQSANFEGSEKLSSAFISGSNIATLIASFGYTGLTTWTCVAPRTALTCCIPVCFIPLAFYSFLSSDKSSSRQEIDTSKYHTISKTPTSNETHMSSPKPRKTTQAAYYFKKIFPYAWYCYVAGFSLAISLTSILTTLTFPSSPFQPRDHYQYYRLASDVGIALGGIEVILVSCLCPKHVEYIRIKRVWILVLLHAFFAITFIFASWFRFIPNVYTLLTLVFIQGIIHGMTTVHGTSMVSLFFHSATERGGAVNSVHVGYSFGYFAAGLVGVFVEEKLKQHCTNALLLGHYCLARIQTTTGWERNIHCSKTH